LVNLDVAGLLGQQRELTESSKTLSFRKENGQWATSDDFNDLMSGLDENILQKAGDGLPHFINIDGDLEPVPVERVKKMGLDIVGDGRYRIKSPQNDAIAKTKDGQDYIIDMREVIHLVGDPSETDLVEGLGRDILEAARP